METMPLRGQSKTRSSSSAVTDSAAGATALACGVRTTNGCIGVYPYDMFGWEAVPYNLTEIAMEKGMNTGVITTDSTTGATPASFSAHTSSRGNAEDIAAQQIASLGHRFDLGRLKRHHHARNGRRQRVRVYRHPHGDEHR